VKYHDYHLGGYSVSDFGQTIRLDLVYDYPNSSKDESLIEFSDVAVYKFIHSGGAIITSIVQTALSEISKEFADDLVEWARKYGGLISHEGNLKACKTKLEKAGYKAWAICSAIGFEGFVIAKSIK
jgi:hypothetical protein